MANGEEYCLTVAVKKPISIVRLDFVLNQAFDNLVFVQPEPTHNLEIVQ